MQTNINGFIKTALILLAFFLINLSLSACGDGKAPDEGGLTYGFGQQPYMFKTGNGELIFPLGLNGILENGGLTLVRFNPSGEPLPSITFKWDEKRRIIDIAPTGDGGFLLAGCKVTANGDSTIESPWAMKTDANGAALWEKDFQLNEMNCFSSLTATDSSYYLTAAVTNDSLNQTAILLKTDNAGEIIWEADLQQFFAFPAHITIDAEGNILTAESDILTKETDDSFQKSFIVQKTSPEGKHLFFQQYINGISIRNIYGASDSGFTISGIFEIQGNVGLLAYGLLHFNREGEFNWQYAIPAIDNVTPFQDFIDPIVFSLSFLSKTNDPNLVLLNEEGDVMELTPFTSEELSNYPLVEKLENDEYLFARISLEEETKGKLQVMKSNAEGDILFEMTY